MNRRKKGRDSSEHTDAAVDLDSSLRKLEELHRVNEQLLHQVEGEEVKEREMVSLRTQLEQARARLVELERKLADIDHLKTDLEAAQARADLLKAHLNTERNDNSRLRGQISELRVQNLRQTLKEDRGSGEASSMPDLHAEPPADSWTASSFTLGDHPELSELISKHNEVTRLNRELQRRCEEQLRGEKRQRPTSAGQSTSYWQTRLQQQEQALRAEMKQREKTLHAQLRELEERMREGEADDVLLKKKMATVQQELQLCEEGREKIRGQLASALNESCGKSEEIRK